MLAALVASCAVPVGFALDTAPVATQFVHVGLLPGAVAAPAIPWVMPDSAKLFVIGSVLFGLAAAVKRTS